MLLDCATRIRSSKGTLTNLQRRIEWCCAQHVSAVDFLNESDQAQIRDVNAGWNLHEDLIIEILRLIDRPNFVDACSHRYMPNISTFVLAG